MPSGAHWDSRNTSCLANYCPASPHVVDQRYMKSTEVENRSRVRADGVLHMAEQVLRSDPFRPFPAHGGWCLTHRRAVVLWRLAAASTYISASFPGATPSGTLTEPSCQDSLTAPAVLVCKGVVTCVTLDLANVVPAATTQMTAGCGGCCARMRCRASV